MKKASEHLSLWASLNASPLETAIAARGATATPAGLLAFFTPVVGTNGEDNLVGGAGNQLFLGKRGADRLESGPGWDILIGGRDGDTFVVDVNDSGNDMIFDLGNAPTLNGYYSSGLDAVELTGYATTDEAMHSIDISFSGDDLIIQYENPSAPGETGQITVKNHFAGDAFALEVVRFGDTAYDQDFHVSFLSGDNFTYSVHSGPDQGGEDIVYGTNLGDEIYGGIGDDILFGGAGVDHFKFHDEEEHGGGHDIILDFELGIDRLDFTDIKTLTLDGITVGTGSHGNALITTEFGTIELIGIQESDVTDEIFFLF